MPSLVWGSWLGPMPAMIFFLLNGPSVQLNSGWLMTRDECHCWTFRDHYCGSQAEEDNCLLSSLGSLLSTFRCYESWSLRRRFSGHILLDSSESVSKVHGVFNNRGILLISGKQSREAAMADTRGGRGTESSDDLVNCCRVWRAQAWPSLSSRKPSRRCQCPRCGRCSSSSCSSAWASRPCLGTWRGWLYPFRTSISSLRSGPKNCWQVCMTPTV